MPPAGRPKALASQLVPENACCSWTWLALVRLASADARSVINTMGVAPTSTTVKAGMVVPLMGSLPLMLNDRTFACQCCRGSRS